MIIIPVPMPDGHAGTPKLPQLSRLEFPSLKPGDMVGVIRDEGGFIARWCAYVYVVPADDEVWWTSPHTDKRIERYWAFHDCRHATTRWGARRHLARMVARYRDGVRQEIEEFRA